MNTTAMKTSAMPDTSGREGVAWGRVALFYGIAFGMVCLLSAFLALRGANLQSGVTAGVYQFVLAFFYMPMPLVAGLVVERVAGRSYLIKKTWAQFRAQWKRVLVISALVPLGFYLLNLVLTLLLGNVLGVAGVGRLVFTAQGVIENMSLLVPASALGEMGATMPPVALLFVLGGTVGIVAGFTINGLFAFGEEYGWRGVLADELKPLGAVKAAVLTGVMWGLWHAPIILLGFNYAQYRVPGVLMMCAWTVPLSLMLTRTRQYTDSVVPSAIIHGAFNGSAGFFLFLVAGRHPLVGAPVGVVTAITITLATAIVWWLTRNGVARMAEQEGSFAAD